MFLYIQKRKNFSSFLSSYVFCVNFLYPFQLTVELSYNPKRDLFWLFIPGFFQ